MREPSVTDDRDIAACAQQMASVGSSRAQASTRRDDVGDDKRAKLSRIIEHEIIPRLLEANAVRASAMAGRQLAAPVMQAHHVGEFADLIIRENATAAIAYFDARLDAGVRVEDLYIDLLAPTARRLGELWETDINDFIDVTRGLSHLQQLVRQHSSAFDNLAGNPLPQGRVLLMTLPGEQHTLGISIVDEFFRRDGWQVWSEPPVALEGLVSIVADQWLDVVGFSLGRRARLSELSTAIKLVRQNSFNPKLMVLVGGKPFADEPELVAAVGADATAIDGREAVLVVKQLLGAKAIRG